jgi:hypothetical protein
VTLLPVFACFLLFQRLLIQGIGHHRAQGLSRFIMGTPS